jgi:predicted small lipoprotein YifL
MKSTVFVALAAALGVSVACGQKGPAEGPTAHPPAEPLTVVHPSAEPPPPEPPPSAEPTASEAEPPPPAEPSLLELCAGVCKKVAAKCPANVAENCELNCDKYETVADNCQKFAREALICAEAAQDLPCANVAPESCGRAFRRLARCQRAPDTFTEQVEQTKGAPDGWQRFEPVGGGFSAIMPPGVEESTAGEEKIYSVKVGDVRYVVRKLPPPSEKFTKKSQIRLAMAWLSPCNYKLRLHGQVEKDERISVHYDSACKDGSERHGAFHITKTALYVVGIEAPAGERGEMEAFVYGFTPR